MTKGISMATLADIRKKLEAIDSRRSGNFATGENYLFWNIADNATAKIRFLPDGNQDNTFFWKEKLTIRLPFPGIKNDVENKDVTVTVPCVEMWGNTCPILTETKPWWNDPSLEDLARKYWKKRTYLFQGFVQVDPMKEESPPENPIRRFSIGPQIYKIIKSSLLDPDFENTPSDYINGSDFNISKTQKGGYADYGTSNWARKESALTQVQLDAIDKYGLKDLSSYLPKQPTPEVLNIIFEMFEASVSGELYDPAKWAAYYRPPGMEYSAPSTPQVSSPTVTVEPATASEKVSESASASTPAPGPTESASTSGKSAQDILEMIRKRNS